jgi:single stranded DNA-binding protein
MSNNITVTGNLTADPEIQYFDSGTAKATFSIADNRVWTDNGEKKEQVSYYDIHAWRYLAEDVARVLSKGVRVTVSGRLEQQTWNDKTTGDKRSKIVIIADQIGLGLVSVESFERRTSKGEGEMATAGAAKAKSAAARKGAPSEEEPF